MQKSIRYIDIHGHMNFPEYEEDREEAIARAAKAGVGMITVGTDIGSSKKAVELSETHENMWATIGIHPTEVVESSEPEHGMFEELRRLALHPKVVAIGECGLDYFHADEAVFPSQAQVFERHISIANEAKKPLMLHVRNGKKKGDPSSTPIKAARNAYRDALDMLKISAKVPFDFHFFAGSMSDMRDIIEAGGSVSFTGVLTFTHDYDELIKAVPVDRIMPETDCPYVAPVPYRGKRSEPINVIEVVKAIARIRGEDEEKARSVLLENARRFFSLTSHAG